MGGRWKRSGHLNPTVEDVIVEEQEEVSCLREQLIREDEDGERTLVETGWGKESSGESSSAEEGGITRKRTIRVIIRSRAFL